MSQKNQAEKLFILQLKQAKRNLPITEYKFHPTRRWRFDFAWVEIKLAVEVQGLLYHGAMGRHQNPVALEGEYNKLNEAQRLGWTVLLFSVKKIQSGEAMLYLEKHFFK